jgi:hypothetical protein
LLEHGAPPDVELEARVALAIHHEHRVRRTELARAFAERALASARDPDEVTALGRRLARLDRKLERARGGFTEAE